MTRIVVQRTLNLLFYSLVLFVSLPGFSGSLKTPPHLPEHPSILVPGRYAFAVWLPIHTFMLMFVIYQMLPKTYILGYINSSISPLFMYHCIGNISWVIMDKLEKTSYYKYRWMRVFFMPVMFIPLLLTYIRTSNRIKVDLANNSNSSRNFYQNYWFGRVWISLYLGWIMYAFMMDSFSAVDVPATYWGFVFASVVLVFICFAAFSLIRVYSDGALAVLYSWILYWLVVKNQFTSDNPRRPLHHTALALFIFFLFITLITVGRNIIFCLKRRQQQNLVRNDEDSPIFDPSRQPTYSV